MIYQNYQLLANAGDQVRGFAELAQSILEHWFSQKRLAALAQNGGAL
jgi:hypothetical protein